VTTTLARLAEVLDGDHRGADVALRDATHDSRTAGPGVLFCAVPGERTDGHDHAPDAVASGTSALLVERWLDGLDVPQLRVASVRRTIGPAAAAVHEDPSRELTVVGITGTNGKTTSAYLVEAAFGAAGLGVGVIGTVETRVHGEAVPGQRTTPEGTDLQRTLRSMRTRGAEAVAMEVSSHGLAMHRVDGTRFAVAVFTNLSQDHLDFHGSMDDYFAAKSRLFTPVFAGSAVICVDDAWGRRLVDLATVDVATFGSDASADHRIVASDAGPDGSRIDVVGPDGRYELRTRLIGDFNQRNALGAYLASVAAGVPPDTAAAGIAACPGVPGRLERVEDAEAGPAVFVDYAHTPDALERVIRVARSVIAPGGRVHVVIGAGGDRDRAKRPLMGAAATAADRVVVTSDNPRTEDPEAILTAVAAGADAAVAAGARSEVVRHLDRGEAIAAAVADAVAGDVVIVAGKGHETGQELADRTVPFDDRQVAAQVLAAHHGAER